VGSGIDVYQAGDTIADRYWLKGNRIVLDTKPGLPPLTSEEIPEALAPYLKLSPYKLHVPQLYGLLGQESERGTAEIWLLEEVPIYSISGDTFGEGELMPELTAAWKTAPALRQLNWLWQIAQLWQPTLVQGVASSLLNQELLRVEGSLVRLLDLQQDLASTPTLAALGKLWAGWAESAHPAVAKFLAQLCQQMISGEVRTAEQLVEMLIQGQSECGRSQSNTYEIATLSDTGPSRRRNEDACYPPSGSKSAGGGLAIVCDGIGGHEGGDVASSLAIDAIRQRVENLSITPENSHPTNISNALEDAAYVANDLISQRNDTEQRHDRQRMGTTVVMALARDREIYIAHVGDSRAYRVSSTGCHQVTLDDDLASREVRLGYALYREAVQQPTSGSLVQALGMNSSAALHPTVQRFVVDEDCVFLICSDGLSDNDRVEQYWETEILPILKGEKDLATASKQLIELGNSTNGHDNVTVALIYCQVTPSQETEQPEVSPARLMSVPTTSPIQEHPTLIQAPSSQISTQQVASSSPQRRPAPLLVLGILVLLGLVLGIAYAIFSGKFGQGDTPGNSQPSQTSTPASKSSSPTLNPTESPDPTAPTTPRSTSSPAKKSPSTQ
jgi:serine/threonine protein phosphatase PrpC